VRNTARVFALLEDELSAAVKAAKLSFVPPLNSQPSTLNALKNV
jgi:hypothetical protein